MGMSNDGSAAFSPHGNDLFGNPIIETMGDGALAAKFILPPFTVLNAREGPWQDRKRAWLALGIQSELGRGGRCFGQDMMRGEYTVGDRASPGGSARPACDYRKRERGDGRGRAMKSGETSSLKGGLTFSTTYDPYRKKFAGGLADGLHDLREAQKRGGELPAYAGQECSGTSIFDPVLCELCYRWFCPPGGLVLDPFAGGSVRGIIAAKLGRQYHGIDLRPEQCAANEAQAAAICPDNPPAWVCGDSREMLPDAPAADLIFSCPPYGDLEIYSDDRRDLSTMAYFDFVKAYREIVSKSAARLCGNRFAIFCVGEYRDARGFYVNFVGETIKAFIDAGLRYYNEAILVTCVGSLPVRVGIQFDSARKLGKTHQNVLCFVKGDPAAAARACGKGEFDETA